ncbi:hypothetical protein THRCLA_22856 [Thraustotheca clavata]|uniref:Polycystin cation channel PKD1/PKD2 domain-containing protein n=1 Tax=Thraustotheca clavata TaxID=74557 RepID=A0A1V9YRR6_9STRA|nr:hypothetical protein THRCLA_22856 [Thraustotheca clavata]
MVELHNRPEANSEPKSLSEACKDGDYDRVRYLLENDKMIDICKEDESGMSVLEYAIKNSHLDCAALIRQEAFDRLKNKNHPFLIALRNKLSAETEFDEELFRQGAENDPEETYKYLDKFVKSDKYDYTFTQLENIFGKNTVKTSALESILNESIIESQMDDKLDLLKHPVLKRVLDIKWELFGARKYFQQLLLYILMLMTMTNIVSSNHTQDNMKNMKKEGALNFTTIEDVEKEIWMQASFFIWVFTIVFCFVGFMHLPHLEPKNFAKLTRWMYDGKYKLEYNHVIPQVDVFKDKALAKLLRDTLLWSLILTVAILGLMYYIFRHNDDFSYKLTLVEAHLYITFTVLWLCALYFLVQEMQEVIGEDPWIYTKIDESLSLTRAWWIFYLIFLFPIFSKFMATYRRYYSSFTNNLQIVTYLIILVPFAFMHYYRILSVIKLLNGSKGSNNNEKETFEWFDSLYFGMGAFCTISLWMLSLQYLEINKTAGYLLPIVQDVMHDVWDFGIFYGVFQCGLTCAFYFIFQQHPDGYKTLWASFCSTYFVMFGENDVSDLIANAYTPHNTLNLSIPMVNVALGLRMFHSAVMVVLLLNLLVAMMNKTVDRNWEKLQSRALTSYARAVLRLETMLGHNNVTRSELMKLPYPGGKSVSNPVFHERVPIQALDEDGFASDDQPDDHAELKKKVQQLIVKNQAIEDKIKLVDDTFKEISAKLG